MKKALLASMILAALVAAQPQDEPDGREMARVSVHEWGVLTALTEGVWALESAPGGPVAFTDPGPIVDRAPVVYMYGPEFTGDFTVTVPSGVLTEIYPGAVEGGASSFTWAGMNADWVERNDPSRGFLLPERVSGWETTPWRVPQSMTLRTAEGMDEFLYYEAEIYDTSFLPLAGMALRDTPDSLRSIPAAVVVMGADGPLVAECTLGSIGRPVTMTREILAEGPVDLRSLFYDWSVDIVDIEEVDALWATWKGWLTCEGLPEAGSGTALVIYRVPESLLDSVATLTLTTDQAFGVDYGRYILCACTVDLSEVWY